jgi:hypothetical protein
MSQAYVLVFGRTLGTRQQVQEVLTAIPGVTYWYACLPYCIFVTSTLDAGTLAKRLEERLGVSQGQRFLVARVSADRQGRLPKAAWHLFRNPDDPRLKE